VTMAYSKQTWTNDDPATPLNATRMGHIEDGIAAADSAAASAQSKADAAAPADHTHSMDDVDGLSSALGSKANSSSLAAKADQTDLEALETRVAALEAAQPAG